MTTQVEKKQGPRENRSSRLEFLKKHAARQSAVKI